MKGFAKRLCALSLSAVMLVTAGACAVQKGGAQTAAPESKRAETSLAGGNQADAGAAASGDAGSGETVTFKVGYAREASFEFHGDETMEDNTWTQLYKENGIQLDVIYNVDISQGNEKLAQTVMAGEYPDVMAIQPKDYTDWAKQGVFADLSEAFDTYASDELKEYYNSEAGKRALSAATVDGKLYGIPVLSTPNDSMPVLWLRKDWLDKLGLKLPETVDDFYAIAKAFTENDPDGDGQNNTYGLALNGKEVFNNVGDVATFFEMFGAQPGHYSNVIPFIDRDGKAEYGGADVEAMTAGLSMLKDMYDSGYISKDFITAGGDQVNQDLAAGKVGMAFLWFAGSQNPWQSALETQPDANFVSVPIPGLTADDRGQAYYTAVPLQYFTLSSQCDYVEQFFKIIWACTIQHSRIRSARRITRNITDWPGNIQDFPYLLQPLAFRLKI